MLLPYVVVKSVSSRPEKMLIASSRLSPEHKILLKRELIEKEKVDHASVIGRRAQAFDK